MAITAADLQAALGSWALGAPKVLGEYPPYGSTKQYWHIVGGTVYAGKAMFVDTTAANDASTQASTVTTALAGAANSDPYV